MVTLVIFSSILSYRVLFVCYVGFVSSLKAPIRYKPVSLRHINPDVNVRKAQVRYYL